MLVGLGIGECIHIFGDEEEPLYEILEDCIETGEEIHLGWVHDESEIPPKLLKYMKAHYPVKTGFSKTLGRNCFANHCACCGALQGNHFLFGEPSSPLSAEVEGNALIERMEKLRIKGIPIGDDLQLDWEVGFGQNDYAYMAYGRYEELVLSSDPENEYISYLELYSE